MAVEKPNILLIVADDLGVDTLQIDDATDQVLVQLKGTAAYPLPNLSRMVSKGIHFTRTWAHPVCAPTRATLFTGLHPWRTGIGDAVDDPILPATLAREGGVDLKTLAHFVSAAGYRTCLLGKWDLGADPVKYIPSVRGWHRHEGILAGGLRFLPENPPNRASYELIVEQDVRYVSWAKVIDDVESGFQENIEPEAREYKYATEDNVYSARNWIKQQRGPWWATIALLAPHDPYHVPPKGTFTIRFQNPAKPTIQEMFAAMMESMDYYLGKLFDDPDIRNQLKNTVIIFVGDNGSQDELDLVKGDDKSSVYIGGVHVPLLIADGGAMFGDGPCYFDPSVISKENDNFVHIVDLYQTIIDIASGQGPTTYKTDSISLLPYLKSNTNEQFRSYTFGQFFVPPNSPDPIVVARYKNLGQRATISDGKYKLNYQNGKYEFTELKHDPVTDLTAESVIPNLRHPKAIELWRALTTPGSPYYAEVDDKGKKFPPLPEVGPQILAIGTDQQLYYRETLTNAWVGVPNSGSVIGVTVLPDGKVLGIGTDYQLYYRETLTEHWNPIPGSGSVIGVTVLPDGKVLGIGTDQQLYYRENDLTSRWGHVPGSGSVIGVTVLPDGKVLGIGTDHQLYYRATLAGNWVHVPNSGSVISVTALPDGKIVGVGGNNQLYSRESLNSPWVHVPDSGSVIGVTYGGQLALLNDSAPTPAPLLDTNALLLYLSADNYRAGDVWQDSSGRNNHATNVPGATMPSLQEVVGYNGKNFKVMRFTSSSTMILPDTLDLQQPYTVMIVDRYSGPNRQGFALHRRDQEWHLGKYDNRHVFSLGGAGTIGEAPAATADVFNLVTGTFILNPPAGSGALGTTWTATWYLDGQLKGNLTRGTLAGFPPAAPGKLALGKLCDVDIAVVLIWNRILSKEERQQVEQWLGQKYGLPTAAGKVTSPPVAVASGEGIFFATDGHGEIAPLYHYTDWRRSWSQMVPGNFGGSEFTDLLFYDATTGEAIFYATDGQGGMSPLRQHTGWRRSWKQMIPGNFGGNSFTDLLFYDPTTGEAEFFATDGQGGIASLRHHAGWRQTWGLIVPGKFSNSGFTDLLLYDPSTGEGVFFTTDGQGGISLLRHHTGWRRTWGLIVPGNFGGNEFTDLLLYDATTGEAVFFTTDGQGGMSPLRHHTGWRQSWGQMVPGNFGGNSFTDLLFYDPTTGDGLFYTTDGQGEVTPLRHHRDWRQSWKQMIPGDFGGNNFTDLLFYDPRP